MKINVLTFLIIASLTLDSCTKNPDQASPDPNQQQPSNEFVYYNYYSVYNALTTIDSVDFVRVCYDLKNDKVVWQKKNKKVIPRGYWNGSTGYGMDYSKSFQTDDAVIRFYMTTSKVNQSDQTPGIDGVYFQKVDKKTGEETLINLIPANELPVNTHFTISQVETDGTNYFFHAVNGFVYCVRPDGSIKWKKGGYTPGNNVGYAEQQWSFVYLYDGKVFSVRYDASIDHRILFGLNTETGEKEFEDLAAYYSPTTKQFLFAKNHFLETSGGSTPVTVLTTYHATHYLGIHNNFAAPIAAWNDSTFLYAYSGGAVRYMTVANPNRISSIPGYFASNMNFIYQDKKLYGATATHNTQPSTDSFFVNCMDPNPANGHILWTKTYPLTNSLNKVLYNYFLKNNRLYLFTNFYIDNNKIVDNEVVGGKYTATAIVINPQTGDIIKQHKGIPLSRSGVSINYDTYIGGMFNITID